MPIYDVYHGTGNTGSIYDQNFSYSYIGNGNEDYGPGFYFTNDLPTSERYIKDGPSPGVIKAKVNLSSPIEVNGLDNNSFFEKFPKLDRDQVTDMLDLSLSTFGDDFLSNWGDVDFEGREVVVQKVINNYTNRSMMTAIYDFFQEDTKQAFDYIRRQFGYDGIVVSFNKGIKTIVSWFPEQINITMENI